MHDDVPTTPGSKAGGPDAGWAPLGIRRDASMYAIDGGWFRTHWHFSFGDYIDPENMGIGTLRVFNDDTLVPGAIWPMHPHQDVEGITCVVAGHFELRQYTLEDLRLIQGRADINDLPFRRCDAAYILDRGLVRVRATTPCERLLVDTTLAPSALGR